MQHNKSLLKQPAGFTLIELLLALVMFAIIVGAIFAAFAAIVDGVERGRQGNELQRTARGAMQRLVQELESAFRMQVQCLEDLPWYICEPLKGEHHEVGGAPEDRVMFLTIPYRSFPTSLPSHEVCSVCYSIAENAQRIPVLWRYEDCTLHDKDEERCSGERDPVELTDTATSLEVVYVDAEEKEHTLWPPADPEGELPQRAHVTLTLQRPGGTPWVFATTVVLTMHGKSDAEPVAGTAAGGAGGGGGTGASGGSGSRGGADTPRPPGGSGTTPGRPGGSGAPRN